MWSNYIITIKQAITKMIKMLVSKEKYNTNKYYMFEFIAEKMPPKLEI